MYHMPRHNYLPLQPLVDAVEERAKAIGRPVEGSGGKHGVPSLFGSDLYLHHSYRLAKKRGRITDFLVDRVCVEVLGLHPFYIYGDAWYESVPND